jgi:hypothetical protein
VSEDDKFGDAADSAARRMKTRTVDMADSVDAQRVHSHERATLEQARFQLGRQSAFDGVVDPQLVGEAQQRLGTTAEKQEKMQRDAQRQSNAQSRPMTSALDTALVGDNARTRTGADSMATSTQSDRQQHTTAAREAASMRGAADMMQSRNFGSALDLQSHKMAVQADVRELAMQRQGQADSRVLADTASQMRFTALEDHHGANMYQEGLISGNQGGEGAERARIKGVDRERNMLATDTARRQALRMTDTEMFEHHTVDTGIGSEPRGGRAAHEQRMGRQEEFATTTPRVNYDAIDDYLVTDHVLQRLDPTRCDKPSVALHEQKRVARAKEIQRLESPLPTHLLPAYMLPGGKKIVTPRGSPASSPRASPVPMQ